MKNGRSSFAQGLIKFQVICRSETADFSQLSLCRGKGPLKNTSDVISAAKKIAEAGSRMDKLGRTIADNVSEVARRGFRWFKSNSIISVCCVV